MKDFMRNNGWMLLLVAVLLAAVTAVGSFLLKGVSNPLTNAVAVLTTPVRNGADAFLRWAEGIYNYSFQYDSLKEENERLKQEIAALEEDARQGQQDSKENARLRDFLDFRAQRRDLTAESAMVTARSSTNWNSTLTLSKGTDMGIEVDDCVLDQAGNLVGIIAETGSNWSTMITVVDASLEMGANVVRTDSAAIVEGDFTLMTENRLKLTYLPDSTELLTGDLVLTSGKGGIYPAGLVVGTIQSIHTDPSGMTRYAVVAPAAALSELVQVFVIKEFDIVE